MNGSVHPAMLIRDGDRVRAATAREEEMGERRAAERASSSEPEYARDRLAQRAANYEVDEEHDIQTQDYEDHTFSGIMFTLEVLDRAVEQVVLRGVAVRGELGPMTVWAAKGRWHDFEGRRAARDVPSRGVAAPVFPRTSSPRRRRGPVTADNSRRRGGGNAICADDPRRRGGGDATRL